ncbi:InlB B-repeat-containing protein [Parasporobacterium paucivorans]|nr:InlB B-repeat-containing protein [Parasporobacterium paucivorans]
MRYWSYLEYGAYNVEGFVSEQWLQTEYSEVYDTRLVVGGTGGIGGTNYDLYEMENGIEKSLPESSIGITQNLSLVNGGRYVKLQYVVRNTSELPQIISLGSYADVMIGDDDYASITAFGDGSGFYMTGDSPVDAQFNFIGKNAYGVTDVDTFWFGYYGDRLTNLFNQTSATSLTDTDSGFAFSWKDRTIPAGASQSFSILIGVGNVNSAPTIKVTTPLETFGNAVKGGTYSFSGTVSDTENTPGTNVYYAIDSNEPVLAYTFSGTPGEFNASILLPADISLGQHTVNFYAQDSDGAISSVVARTILVVEQYTVTFESNGGSAFAPLTGIVPGSTITVTTAPTRSGYTFAGWYKDASFANVWNFATDTVTANTTLYAKWTATAAAVKTGDASPIIPLVILIGASMTAAGVSLRKYKSKWTK